MSYLFKASPDLSEKTDPEGLSSVRPKKRRAEPPPSRRRFGGCNKLLSHYRTIGRELRRSERSRINYGWGSSRIARQFREGVSFVPLEVLESYLEDLLDRETTEENLFIARPGFLNRLHFLIFAGFGCSLSAGLYFASSGASLFHSFALMVALSLPFAMVAQLYPYGDLGRRLGFARLLSQEIFRRRGMDKDGRSPEWSPPRFAFADLLAAAGSEPAQGAAAAMSRSVVRILQ